MTRTFNDASFEGTERITDELIASFGDDWYPDDCWDYVEDIDTTIYA